VFSPASQPKTGRFRGLSFSDNPFDGLDARMSAARAAEDSIAATTVSPVVNLPHDARMTTSTIPDKMAPTMNATLTPVNDNSETTASTIAAADNGIARFGAAY